MKLVRIFRIVWCWVGVLLGACGVCHANETQLMDPPQGIFFDGWYDVRLSGQRIGYMNFAMRREGDEIQTVSDMYMNMARGGDHMGVRAWSETRETVDGDPRGFSMVMEMGQQPVRIAGEMREGRVYVEYEQGGAIMSNDFPFPADTVMVWGMERRLKELGTEPGASMRVSVYSPDMRVDGPVDALVEVVGERSIELDGATVPTTEFITRIISNGVEMESRSWVDSNWEMVRTVIPFGAMELEMSKTTNQKALEEFYPPELFESTLLSVGSPVPVDARFVTYRLRRTDDGTLRPHLLESPFQMVEYLSDSEALITVVRSDFSVLAGEAGSEPVPDESFLGSNLYINADDPVIRDLAAQATDGMSDQDDFAIADALRRFVTDLIEDKNMSIGFASASEVARMPEGDCTEHAVLLAALGRAVGIPSRVVSGLILIPVADKEALGGFHMWTQFYLNGHWVDVDAAMEESECSPTRIAFYESNLDNIAINDLSFRLLDIMGRLQLDIDSVH